MEQWRRSTITIVLYYGRWLIYSRMIGISYFRGWCDCLRLCLSLWCVSSLSIFDIWTSVNYCLPIEIFALQIMLAYQSRLTPFMHPFSPLLKFLSFSWRIECYLDFVFSKSICDIWTSVNFSLSSYVCP